MKKFTVILFVLISIFSGDQVYGFQKEEKKFSREKYHAVQKLFILEKLDLSAENEEEFWAIYMNTQKQILDSQRKCRRIRKELYENDSASISESNKLFDELFQIQKEELIIKENLMKELAQIMPVKKVLKLPRIEEQFRRSMIDKIRGKNND
ncbi:MAG: hypothetical protein VYB19_04695 [Bacteroidota bacterium]|nr:hypothetical protein [Bacteroidota bacterium]MEE2605436.1 hypothetical protein [Bacteroidota bacterium]